ncbi:thyroid receptor-interacting protein 11 isoform X1 [Drosophila tropicalis]|uniref:thyroid receptor-interacting protein 11 isoform X1 n=2 Tax=Drosophila tropicalis TaxID=46794 RepID=UPI0035ABD404
MSWLNQSLSNIKGQLTNLAQEVLADTAGPGDEDYQGPEQKTALELLAETQKQKEQLDRTCEEKDREITALRKQITQLKQINQQITDSGGGVGEADKIGSTKIASSSAAATSTVEATEKLKHKLGPVEEQNVEDSWCWEPDEGSDDNGNSGSGKASSGTGELEMVDIALGNADVSHLNSRIVELEQLNSQLNASLEELDAQHDQAMQDVLQHKGQLQGQLQEMKQLQADRVVAHELAMARLQKQVDEQQIDAVNMAEEKEHLVKRLEIQEAELKRSLMELADMQELLEKRGQDNSELIERVRLADTEREKLIKEVDELKQTKEKKNSESSSNSSSMGGKHSEDEFIVVRQGGSPDPDTGDTEADTEATLPPSKEKLRDKLVSLESRIAELSLENGKLQDAQLEKQLSTSLLNEQLSELETRLRISEGEKEQLQLELQCKLQQLTLQNQELKLNAEAEQETHAHDLEQQLGALRSENRDLRQELESNIAQAKFRQAIAEEKQEVTDLDEADNDSDHPPFDLEKLRHLLQAELEGHLEVDSEPQQTLERAYRALTERWARLDATEQRLVELQDQQLITEHEKKTIEADISQYILQCDELMKNNELLLNELDKYKRNKLETIEEHHEETIVQLEAQLDEARHRLEGEKERYRLAQDDLQEQYKSQLSALQSQMLAKDQEDEENTSSNELDNLKEQLERQSKEINELTTQLRDHQVQSQQQTEELTHLRTQLNEKLLAEQNVFKLLEEKSQQLKAHLDRLDEKESQLEKVNLALAELESTWTSKHSQTEELANKYKSQLEALHNELPDQISQLTKQLEAKEQQLLHLQEQLDLKSSEDQTPQLQSTIEVLSQEKAELIKVLQQKHSENTQYYAEIQRLQPFEKQLMDLVREREKLNDQIAFLKEKSDILTTNLLTEQTNQRLLQQQQLEAKEQQATVQKDLERLREHLLKVEELHTQETVELQRDLEESKSKQAALQQEVSKSSTAYTSASIRANQQAETLQAQHALLQQQRDELLAKLSACEDRELKQLAALTNLQCALEQFQNDKEHDIEMATQRIRREMQLQLDKQGAIQTEVAGLQQQLAEANQGLRAAARLSDQLELGQQTIAVLRDEVESLKEANGKLEQSLSSSESSQSDKIDKSLIKSLLIGYVVSGHAGDKQQVLRMISSVLDFNAQESDKVGLNKPQSSWLGSILGGVGSTSGATTGSSNQGQNDNLVQAFVQFLEQESQPQVSVQSRPTLLSIAGQVADGAAGSSASASSSSSAAVPAVAAAPSPPATNSQSHPSDQTPSNVPQSMLLSSNEFAPTRNSSSILKDILSDS